MARPIVTPRDFSREFNIDELFFSTTDERGVITSGNSTFARVSGYPIEKMIGEAHNLIRHPDMPMSVFHLFWEYLNAGKTVAAYVKNLAADGGYYWVVAVAAPIPEGYLSVRFKPSSALLGVVESLYKKLIEVEGKRGLAGIPDGRAAISGALAGLGFPDYDAFMRKMLQEELQSRDQQLLVRSLNIIPPIPARGDVHSDGFLGNLHRAAHQCRKAYSELGVLYKQIDAFAAYTDELEAKSRFVLNLSKGFRLISMNTGVRSVRLGDRGKSLGVIAEHMGSSSQGIEGNVSILSGRVGGITNRLRSVVFDLAVARLQLEVVCAFCAEGISSDENEESVRARIQTLQDAFVTTFNRAISELTSLGGELFGLEESSQELQKTVLTLRFSQLAGTVEACRLEGEEDFQQIFREISRQLEDAETQLADLSQLVLTIKGHVDSTPRIAGAIRGPLVSSVEELRG